MVTDEGKAVASDDAPTLRESPQHMIEHRGGGVCEQALANFLARHAFFQWMTGVITRDSRDQCAFDGSQLRRRDQHDRNLDHEAFARETVDERLALGPWHTRPAGEPIDRHAGQTGLANHRQDSVGIRLREARKARSAGRRAYPSSRWAGVEDDAAGNRLGRRIRSQDEAIPANEHRRRTEMNSRVRRRAGLELRDSWQHDSPDQLAGALMKADSR